MSFYFFKAKIKKKFICEGATGFEGGYHKQMYPRISTNTSIYEKAVGEEVTLWCDPQVSVTLGGQSIVLDTGKC